MHTSFWKNILDQNAAIVSNLHYKWDSEVFIIQGESRKDLIAAAELILEFILHNPDFCLKDLAYTLNHTLSFDTGLKCSIVASSSNDLKKKLKYTITSLKDNKKTSIKDISGIYFFEEQLANKGDLAFVFPGQGSMYQNMLSDLCIHFPEIRTLYDLYDQAAANSDWPELPSQLLLLTDTQQSELTPNHRQKLNELHYSAGTVFIADIALLYLLSSLKIKPKTVVGHSVGDFAAQYAAGIVTIDSKRDFLDYTEKLSNTYFNFKKQPKTDIKFITAGARNPETVLSFVKKSKGKLFITMDNCPNQIIICGTSNNIDEAIEQLKSKQVFCAVLPYDLPYHTPLFKKIWNTYKKYHDEGIFNLPKLKIYSCITAKPYPYDIEKIKKLTMDQFVKPVDFRNTILSMYEAGARIFVEVGPRDNLTNFVDNTLKGKNHVAIASNVHNRSSLTQINHLIGFLASCGVNMQLDYLYKRRNPEYLSLNKSSKVISLKPLFKILTNIPTINFDKEDNLTAPLKADDYDKEMTADRYFSKMEHFLDTEQEFMTAALNGDSGKKVNKQENPVSSNEIYKGKKEELVIEDTVNLTNGNRGNEDNPFNIKEIHRKNNEDLLAECQLDLNEHIFLQHHTLGLSPSVADPSLTGLPVVPLAFSIEIMVQTAALLKSDLNFKEIKNVRAVNWIMVETPICNLKIIAKSKNNFEVYVKITKLNEKNTEILLAEGIAVFGKEFSSTGKVNKIKLKSERSYRFCIKKDYIKLVSVGKCLQGVCSIDKVGDNGLEAKLKKPVNAKPFFTYKNPRLIAQPVILDLAFQTIGFWARDLLEKWEFPFLIPGGFSSLEFYGNRSFENEIFKCYVHTFPLPPAYIKADIDMVDSNENLVLRIKGLNLTHFYDWTVKFSLFTFSPVNMILSVPFSEPVSKLPFNKGFYCCRTNEKGSNIWSKVLSFLIFNENERKKWFSYNDSLTNNSSDALLRNFLAVKDAVRLLFKDRLGLKVRPADIEIISDQNEVLIVNGLEIDNHKNNISVSTAYTNEEAVAIACDNPKVKKVGIEVKSLVKTTEKNDSKEWEYRIICAKGAVIKMLGKNLVKHPDNLIIKHEDLQSGKICMILSDEMAQKVPEFSKMEFIAYTGYKDNLVFGTSFL